MRNNVFSNLSLYEALATCCGAASFFMSFKPEPDDAETRQRIREERRKKRARMRNPYATAEDDIDGQYLGDSDYSNDEKSTEVRQKTDIQLLLATGIPVFLSASTALGDAGEFGKPQSELSYKNANSLFDWIIVLGYGYAAYRYASVYKNMMGAAAAGGAALLYLISMLTTTPQEGQGSTSTTTTQGD